MWKNRFVYLKCVWSNKATLWGYILLISFSIQIIFIPPDLLSDPIRWGAVLKVICLSASIVLLGLTLGGIETYRAYKVTSRAIRINGKEGYRNSIPAFYTYCGTKGVQLAEKEAGIKK